MPRHFDFFIFEHSPSDNTWAVYRAHDRWEVCSGLSFEEAAEAAREHFASLPF